MFSCHTVSVNFQFAQKCSNKFCGMDWLLVVREDSRNLNPSDKNSQNQYY